ncbi:MAG: hypothetical protein ACTHMC_01360 [Pseudobacter sp.]|uniref:hypothetical protein n=1 Tax=Pseudobacter sp. TaxID=2045420 RepID=UPI003F7DAF30
MKMQIIGKGGFAREVSHYDVMTEVVFFEHECEGISPNIPTVIAIGDVYVRKMIASRFKELRYDILNAGQIWGANNTVFPGTIICPGTHITTGVTIGQHVIINLNCTVGHDCRIGDFVTISPGVNISGNVTIGDLCSIGSNAVIREKISICDDVVIGAGSVVVKDITERGIYVGNPAKKIS